MAAAAFCSCLWLLVARLDALSAVPQTQLILQCMGALKIRSRFHCLGTEEFQVYKACAEHQARWSRHTHWCNFCVPHSQVTRISAGSIFSYGYGIYTTGGRPHELVGGLLWKCQNPNPKRARQDVGPICCRPESSKEGMTWLLLLCIFRSQSYIPMETAFIIARSLEVNVNNWSSFLGSFCCTRVNYVSSAHLYWGV